MPGKPNMKREVTMRRLSQALRPRSKIVMELLMTGLKDLRYHTYHKLNIYCGQLVLIRTIL